jgi:hypothetical protein
MTAFHFHRGATPSISAGISLRLGKDVLTGERDFKEEFGAITTLESDLLSLASCIFAADRGMARGEREDFSRSIELHIPVVNIGRLFPLAGKVEEILRLLSNDLWTIHLSQANGTIEPSQPTQLGPGKVLLFSGGLDSLAAAIEFSGEQPSLALVSHVTKNRQTTSAQTNLRSALVGKRGQPHSL